MIGDPVSVDNAFTDDQIQMALDVRHDSVRYSELEYAEEFTPSATHYHDYYADRGDWESDVALYDASWNTLAPSTSDYVTGHWTFTANREPPVFLVGKTYDLNAAAAELLIQWAGKVKAEFDFSADGLSASRSQKGLAILTLAREYQAKGRVRLHTIRREDLNG
jgi:hypothetical protein